jgi:hypothetical protein
LEKGPFVFENLTTLSIGEVVVFPEATSVLSQVVVENFLHHLD